MDLPTPNQPPPIRQLEQRSVYSNRFLRIYDDIVSFANGNPGTYVRIVEAEGKSGAAILPLAGGHVGLVCTYRYPIREWEWGIPRGFAHGSDPEVTALAELSEEIGAEPEALKRIATINPNSGILSSAVHVFVARYAKPISCPSDRDEIFDVRWLHKDELMAHIASGCIKDAFTIAAIGATIASGQF
ncbi:NUDIX hydrolase [Streptomyces sp. NPDC006314]|uniref:NUDIX hydrolase n=1 Tax=Streptomyces sp. NPDC006314 TaxID=3154475 RepID=UPI0033B677AF